MSKILQQNIFLQFFPSLFAFYAKGSFNTVTPFFNPFCKNMRSNSPNLFKWKGQVYIKKNRRRVEVFVIPHNFSLTASIYVLSLEVFSRQ